MGTQIPLSKKGTEAPIFGPCLLWPNGWMDQMPLGMEVGLDPGHIVLDGYPAPPKKGHSPHTFGPCLLWPSSWMDQDAIWYEGKPRPRPYCVTWGSSFPHQGHSPNFRPMSIVAKRSPISATAGHLYLRLSCVKVHYFTLGFNVI